ncbi:hypothetical protein NDR87_34505 [Nocardia sp. CDC159]|uniref:Uncharacterized protein n=1 Tax=Nocardia pulmonis TaxID=2951408 RepID=A0A9X2ED08_9NOCA|nr:MULTISPECIES: hypothetical protein [Nocardia]MCM6778604.1 hypothetical protein [Nocardia pulmonis]MCM6791493.1 hypothetical protein [Nocardia sp. CDC159]
MSIRETIENAVAQVKAKLGGSDPRPTHTSDAEIGDEHGSVTTDPRTDDPPGEPESSPRGIGGMDI